MQTEFTCGIYTAIFHKNAQKWSLQRDGGQVGLIDYFGDEVHFHSFTLTLKQACLIEIAVLMNNIKRQYKQLQTT